MKKWIAMFLIPLALVVSACAEDPSGCENDEHTMEIIQNILPTCTEPGFCVEKCSLCGIEVTTSFPPFGHTPENIPGCDPTETAEGLTPGVRCVVCKAILQEQQIIPRLEPAESESSGQPDPPTEEPIPEPDQTEIVGPSVPPEALDAGTPVPPVEPQETESTLPPETPVAEPPSGNVEIIEPDIVSITENPIFSPIITEEPISSSTPTEEPTSSPAPTEKQPKETISVETSTPDIVYFTEEPASSPAPTEEQPKEPPSDPVGTNSPDIVYFTEEPAPSPSPIEEPVRETASASVETSSPDIVYFTEEPVSSPAPDTEPPIVYFTEAPSFTTAPAAAETEIPQNQPPVSSVQEAAQNTDTKAFDEKAPSSPSSSRTFTSMELILLPEGKSTTLVLLVAKPDEGSEVSFFLRLWLVTSDGIAMELQPGSCEILMDGSALISDTHFMHFNGIDLMPEVPAENWMNCSFIHYNGQPAFTLSDSFFRLQLPPETLETVNAYLGENTTLKCLAGQVESSAE